jgi:hypothetical protein
MKGFAALRTNKIQVDYIQRNITHFAGITSAKKEKVALVFTYEEDHFFPRSRTFTVTLLESNGVFDYILLVTNLLVLAVYPQPHYRISPLHLSQFVRVF